MTTAHQPDEDGKHRPTRADVATYKLLLPMLDSLYVEMKDFCKKHPDKQVNKFRVRKINEILTPLKNLLRADSSVEYLELLSEEELPENGDAVIILGQFQAALKQYSGKHTDKLHRWLTQEDFDEEKAAREARRRQAEEEDDFDDEGDQHGEDDGEDDEIEDENDLDESD